MLMVCGGAERVFVLFRLLGFLVTVSVLGMNSCGRLDDLSNRRDLQQLD